MAYAYIEPREEDNTFTREILMRTLNGVEGIPYQFLPSVDRRFMTNDQSSAGAIGRKYAEKIISRIPLLFLTPCEPVFMGDLNFTSTDKENIADALLTQTADALNFENATGKYYSVDFAYARYYDYLNCMLASVAHFLGIANDSILINGKYTKIKDVNWADEVNPSFKTYFTAQENLVFYLDAVESISESFSNNTTQSTLASMINGLSDQAKELEFLFGKNSQNIISTAINNTGQTVSSVAQGLSESLNLGELGGTIVESLAGTGIDTVLDGGKIIFPEIWSDSSYEKSYSLDLKLRSPDNDSLSIFLNVLKPYCKILALTLPHIIKGNVNAYRTPFLVKAYCKGLFNIDMGIISGLSVTKGASCCWNDDGLPTQIDISIDITNLYKSLAMTGYSSDTDSVGFLSNYNILKHTQNITTVANNTSYMDFLANMAGLNICEMEYLRKVKMLVYLFNSNINTIESTTGTRFGQSISKIIGNVYKIT